MADLWRLVSDSKDGLFEQARRVVGRGQYRGLEFYEVEARSVINEVPPASRMPFRWTINAYRGCSHGCLYCFARPTHDYLGFGIGEDFDRRIVVKVNAVERVEAETHPRRWGGHYIAMGTNTDPYQPAEGRYKLTRGIIEVLTRRRNPFSILTKSTLVLRDLELLQEAAASCDIHVDFSIGTLDEEAWRKTEPGTPHPMRRVEAVARLNGAGIPSGVLMAPVLPGISDRPDQLRSVVRACREAGARFIYPILLHLRPGVREHYLGWLKQEYPELVSVYEDLYRGRSYLPSAATVRLTGVAGLGGEKRDRPSRGDRQPAQLRLRIEG